MQNGLDKPIINWDFLGAYLAQADDETQAEFFKAFFKEVKTYPTHHAQEMQMLYIGKHLDDEDRELLKTIAYKEGDA